MSRPSSSARQVLLERERLRSEGLRAAVMAGFLCLVCLVQVTLFFTAGDHLHELFGGFRIGWILLGVLVLIGLELATWRLCFRRAKESGSIPGWLRYLVSGLEVSLPTAVLLALGWVFGPVTALTLPPLLLYPFFIFLSVLRLDPRLSLFTGALAAAQYALLACLHALPTAVADDLPPVLSSPIQHLIKVILLLVSGALAAFIAAQVRRQLTLTADSTDRREEALETLGQAVSSPVAEHLLADSNDLGTQSRPACVLFVDAPELLRPSSAGSEDPLDNLNRLLEALVTAVHGHGGIVNKFVGHGLMASFGLPSSDGRDATNAVRAALEMVAAVDGAVETGSLPSARLGIGIHMGEVLAGTVGSVQRKEYAVLGEVVELAARLQRFSHEGSGRILFTRAVRDELSGELPGLRSLGEVAVTDVKQQMELYELA
ncbi:MAG: adenylate/guanylate cyclase domain-containing protein [Acidobacteriota bacterium]